jgi:hypothetical protein
MAKFTWQDGTLVSKAKVEIGGTIYEVDPEEYSGATPLSASNLNAMQDGIYEDINEVSDIVNELISVNIIPDTEIKLNYKFNGNDVYFKRVSISSFPNATTKIVNTNISNGILIRSNIYMDDGSQYILLPYVSPMSQIANMVNGSVTKNCNSIYLTAGTDRSALSGFADIWYIKTAN